MPLYLREESFETANEAPKRWLVGTETLQMILDKKEEKLNLYQSKKLNAYWLIIVVPPLSLAQFELPPQLLHFKFHTRFNRVFLLLADQKKLMVIA